MYAYIKGILTQTEPLKIILENQKIGFEIFIPLSTYSALPPIGEEVIIHTHFHVREDAQILYGFFTAEEKKLFELLLSVSGIGPRTALTMVGNLEPSLFYHAVFQNDVKTLVKIPGLGKKTAERLILELKDKCKDCSQKPMDSSAVSDALQALIHLGYNSTRMQKVLQKIAAEEKETDTASLIRKALQKI